MPVFCHFCETMNYDSDLFVFSEMLIHRLRSNLFVIGTVRFNIFIGEFISNLLKNKLAV